MIRGRSEDWQAASSREPALMRFASALLAGRNMHLPDATWSHAILINANDDLQ